MKKLLVVLTLTTVLTFSFCMFGCSEKKDDYGTDTFVGAISEETYESDEDAVKGFLENEISGEAVKAELVNFEQKKELSKSQIGQLAVDKLEEDEEIVSAKEVKVTYKRNDSGRVAQSEDNYFEFTIYVLEITSHGTELHTYRYYVPKANVGDVLTRSYYDDLLNPEKYINCTQEYTSVAKQGSIEITQNYLIKIAENKAFINLHIVNPNSTGFNIEYMDLLAYFEYDDDANELKIWASNDNGATYILGSNYSFASLGVTDIKSLSTMCIPKIDYSYYIKTDFGFKISEDFLNKYISKVYGYDNDSINADCNLNVYIQDGKIVKMESDNSITIKQGFSMTIKNSESLEFKDFGTTSVEKPANIK